MKKILTTLIFLYSLYLFITRWVAYTFSNFSITFYDGTLRVLPHFFIQQGLTPYKDFDYPYAPGLLVLVGNIIPFVSIFQRNLILATITLLFIIFGVILIYTISHDFWRTLLTASGFLLLQVLVVEFLVWSDPISLVLLADLLLVVSIFLLKKMSLRAAGVSTVVLSIFLIFLRWDWIIAIASVVTFSGVVWWLRVRGREMKRYGMVVALFWIGIGTGILLLFGYLWCIHAVLEGIQSIVTNQLTLNPSYRRIYLSQIFQLFGEAFVFCGSVAAFGLLAFSLLFVKKFRLFYSHERAVVILLLASTASFLPYVFSRIDVTHVLPFAYVLGVSCIILYAKKPHIWIIIVMIVLLLPMNQKLLPDMPLIPPVVNYQTDYIKESIADCADSIPADTRYKSLFVGRLNYDQTTASIGMLYFINPDLPPATPYFMDAPGIQTSCSYGATIVNQLKHAPKPILAFIDLTAFDPENMEILQLKSCGKIETYLRSSPYRTVGTCRAFDHQIVIRVYE